MDLRLAVMDDLLQIKDMYKQIVDDMIANHVRIWDEGYPGDFFEDDIRRHQLYVLIDRDQEIVSAFALCQLDDDSETVGWQDRKACALYICRLGVKVDYLRKGAGSAALEKAIDLARHRKAEYLRLFVAVDNDPAVHLYQKAGFQKADGVCEQVLDDGYIIREFGFEIKT